MDFVQDVALTHRQVQGGGNTLMVGTRINDQGKARLVLALTERDVAVSRLFSAVLSTPDTHQAQAEHAGAEQGHG